MEITKNKQKQQALRAKAEALVAQMSVPELVSQTLHSAAAIERLGIPAYNWWNEALHGVARAGVATVFPQAIGLAATFDEDFLEEIADAISTEGRGKYNMQQEFLDRDIYKGLTFWSPNVNIFRDPRWGRGHETFGEDPFLTSRLGVRFIEGLQGHDEEVLKAAACAKHFAAHSGPEGIRHSFNAEATVQDLRETYLPAFEACVKEAGVESVMGAYNRFNGAPCCGHHQLLIEILREEWGFLGHVVSDCWAIRDFHEGHMVTDNPVDSVSMAMNNGCDLNCGNLYHLLVDAVGQGKVQESRLREAVTNLFTTRLKLGLLQSKAKSAYDEIPYSVVDSSEMRALNRRAALRVPCLLKNNGVLPLKKNALKTVGVIGPNANSRRALEGNYEGTASRYITVVEGIQDYLGESVVVRYSEGCHLFKDRVSGLGQPGDRFAEAKAVCKESDVVVLVLGLDADIEGEQGDTGNQFASGDKLGLSLPGQQNELLRVVLESGKPVVVVLLAGSALTLDNQEDRIAAVVHGWYPGAEGGFALARLLFGEENFEGKLPVTFYRSTQELPAFTDYSMKNRTYRYMQNEALYPFGYGLSYTKFSYENPAINTETLTEAGVTLSATVKNTGERAGTETVQVYVSAPGENAPVRQLKGIRKLSLQPGEQKKVEITLPLKAFGLYDSEGIFKIAAGTYRVSIGGCQPEARSEALTGNSVRVFTLENTVEQTV